MTIPLWRQIQRTNFTRIELLCDFLELSASQKSFILSHTPFPLNLPRRLAEKISKRNLEDPLFRQFVPLINENEKKDNFNKNPVGDCEAQKAPRLLKKYQNRALLICTSACAMHCRYCFRRHYPYEEKSISFEKEIAIIQQENEINELILSGGDPLSLSNHNLNALLQKIAKISHVKRLRFHTRFPIGIPQRIDDEFLNLIDNVPQQVYFVIHCNHPKELGEDIFNALKPLQKRGIILLNQAVLLKGINDEIKTLKELSETLVDHAILPYYLHQLDRVEGGAHFEVPIEKGKLLISELAKVVSGYALPKYVQEVAGEPHKTPL